MFLQNINFFSIKFVINLLISIIPISYIAGNLVLNLNIVLIIITSFSFFGKEIIQLKLCTLDKIILAFFLYIFLNGFYNNYFNFNFADAPKNYILFKSLLYFRYLFVVKKRITNYFKSFKCKVNSENYSSKSR